MNDDNADETKTKQNQKLVISFRTSPAEEIEQESSIFSDMALSVRPSQQNQVAQYLHKLETVLKSIRCIVASNFNSHLKLARIEEQLQISSNILQLTSCIQSKFQQHQPNNPTLEISNYKLEDSVTLSELQGPRCMNEGYKQEVKGGDCEKQKLRQVSFYKKQIERLGEQLKQRQMCLSMRQEWRKQREYLLGQITLLQEQASFLKQQLSSIQQLILERDQTLMQKDQALLQREQTIRQRELALCQLNDQILKKNEEGLLACTEITNLKQQIHSLRNKLELGHQQQNLQNKQFSQTIDVLKIQNLALMAEIKQLQAKVTNQSNLFQAQKQENLKNQENHQKQYARLNTVLQQLNQENEAIKKRCEELLQRQHISQKQAQAVIRKKSSQLNKIKQFLLTMEKEVENFKLQNQKLKDSQALNESREAQWKQRVEKLQELRSADLFRIKELENKGQLLQKELLEEKKITQSQRQRFSMQYELIMDRARELEQQQIKLTDQINKIAVTFKKIGLNFESFIEASFQSQNIDQMRKKLKAILLEKEKEDNQASLEKFFAILREYKSKFPPEALLKLKRQIGFQTAS